MPSDSRLLRLTPWFIGIGGLLLFTLGLDHRDFIHLEARFALFAQTMLREGVGFFPTLYGEPYPDYPAPGPLLIDLVSLFTGRVTTATAVLPTAAAASMTLVFTYLIGALHTPRWGLYAVLFELCTNQFLATARSVSLDPFVAMATTGCFYAAYSAMRLQRPWRVSLIPFGWTIGFLMRGPIGLIIPATVVAVFYLLERRRGQFVITSALALVLLALGMAGLLAAARAQGGPGFADQVLRSEALGRVAAGTTTHPPVYSYLVNALAAFALSFPVAAALVALGFRTLIQPETNEWRLLRHLAAWTLVIMAGLSIPSKQEIRYLIPIVPAVALMAAAPLAGIPLSGPLKLLRKGVLSLFVLMPWLGLGLIVAGLSLPRLHALVPADARPGTAAVILVLIGLLTPVLKSHLRDIGARDLATVTLSVAGFVAVTVLIVEPITVDLNRVGPFVDAVRSHRTAGAPIAFYKIGPDAADVKFMAALDESVRPLFVRAAAEVDALPSNVIVIAGRDAFDELPPELMSRTRLLSEGRIARSHCVAFVMDPSLE